jgi:sporulation integral membrane protein YlbJ
MGAKMQVSTNATIVPKNTNRKLLSKAFIVLFLILILFFPVSSYNGAKKGLLLWFNTILPTLLPFIIISNLIIRLKITEPLSKLFYPFFHLLFGVSKGGCYPVLMGFLTGIPVGAKSIADLVNNGSIRKEEGQFLLSFCNNASPMFIMSFIAITQLKQINLRVVLLTIIYISAVLASIIYFKLIANPKRKGLYTLTAAQNEASYEQTGSKFDFALFDSAIMDGFEVITKVGGYIIMFSIPAQIIVNLGSADSLFHLLCIGFLEITTGINQIGNSNLDMQTKIALITMITAFGGLSGMAQTKSVISNTRLSIGIYFKVKLLHMLLALLLATFYVNFIY